MLNQVAGLALSALAGLVLHLEVGVDQNLGPFGQLAQACHGTFTECEDVME
jgi:hypothetical protein